MHAVRGRLSVGEILSLSLVSVPVLVPAPVFSAGFCRQIEMCNDACGGGCRWDVEKHQPGPNYGDLVNVSSVIGNWVQVAGSGHWLPILSATQEPLLKLHKIVGAYKDPLISAEADLHRAETGPSSACAHAHAHAHAHARSRAHTHTHTVRMY